MSVPPQPTATQPSFDVAEAYVLAPLAGCSRLGGEIVLLDPAGQTLRGVNARGGQVLSLLDGRRTVTDIGVALDAPSDVEVFVGRLLAAGLLVRASGSVAPLVVPAAELEASAPAVIWEQRFVGLQELSDPCQTQNPPPGYCGASARFGDFGGGAQGP